ncbi:MAG TPA: VWA domain-containing protein [Blastocatellia bacterium]|nr:VWA domain-containing protein [Blastocatellia bacterium]
MRNPFRVAVVVLCLSVTLNAQSGRVGQRDRSRPEQQQSNEDAIQLKSTLVSVPVIVSDRGGRYISNLKREDFKLYEDRAEQKIAVFDTEEEALNVALLLDTSQSTAGVLDDIKKSATKFLKELRPKDKAMVVTFDAEIRVLCGLTSDQRELEHAVKSAQNPGRFGTKLRDAVAQVFDRYFKNVEGRKAIILLTDGKDAGSYVPEDELFDKASESGAMVYPVFFETRFGHRNGGPQWGHGGRGGWGGRDRFPQGQDRRGGRASQRNERAEDFLTSLAEVSAGRFFSSKVEDLKSTFSEIAEELRHQYRLGFYPDPGKADGQKHSIRVEVSRQDLAVRARRSYQAVGH